LQYKFTHKISLEMTIILTICKNALNDRTKIVQANKKTLHEDGSCTLTFDLSRQKMEGISLIDSVRFENMDLIKSINFARCTNSYKNLSEIPKTTRNLPIFQDSEGDDHVWSTLAYFYSLIELEITLKERVSMRKNPIVVLGRELNPDDKHLYTTSKYSTAIQQT
jgi:hypothetical protein